MGQYLYNFFRKMLLSVWFLSGKSNYLYDFYQKNTDNSSG